LKNLELANPVTVNITKNSEGDLGGTVNLILSRAESQGLVIDIVPVDPTENAFAAHQQVRAAIEKLQHLQTMQELVESVCVSFKGMYNYHRAMVYRFHEDYHGEVLAELLDDAAAKNGFEPYLGLHFPATDLPQTVRQLFKTEHVRVVYDSSSDPSDLISSNPLLLPPSAVNLSMSTLRRPHKCHLEYMANMGVTSSIGIAIIVRDQLWGLIIGHHQVPKAISYHMRMAGDFLAQALSMRITALLDKENHEQHRATLDLHVKLCDLMAAQGLNPGLRLRGLVSSSPSLLDLVPGVCGVAVMYGGKVSTVGKVPGIEVLTKLAEGIDKHWLECATGREAKGWDRLLTLLKDPRLDTNDCAGVLSVPVLEDGQLLFLRPELSTTIRWAGDPKKYAKRESTGALHPRASFEIYSDSVRGLSAPWKKKELDAVAGLGLLVNDMARTAELDASSDAVDSPSRVGMRLVMADHERTRGETESAQQEIKRLMDSVQAPVFAVDEKLRLVQWNNMCEKLTGYSKSQILGGLVLDITAKPLRAPLQEVLLQALSGEEARSFQVSLIKSRAHELPEIARQVDLLLNAAANFDLHGKIVGVHCVCQDVTSNRITKDSQEVLSAQLQQVVKLANQMQPNFFDATESQFVFDNDDKDAALLGEGAFGKTYKMRNKIDDQCYAVKMIKVSLLPTGSKVQILTVASKKFYYLLSCQDDEGDEERAIRDSCLLSEIEEAGRSLS